MKQARVLFLHKDFVVSGGIERVHQNLAMALTSKDACCFFYVMNGFGKSEAGFEKLSSNYRALRADVNTNIFGKIKQVIALVSELNISTIISATEQANVLAFFCKLAKPKIKAIYTRHCAFDVSDQKLAPWAIKMMYSLYALNGSIVGVSNALSAQIKSSIIINKSRVCFIPNAVISEQIYVKSQQDQEKIPVEPYFISIGRLVEQKGFDLLFEAYAKARQLNNNLPLLLIAGEGEGRAELHELAVKLNISEQVIFVGYTDNPYSLLRSAEAFILSSRHEGMPTVLIEAMALNTPVVAFDCPTGPAEIIQHKKNGLLIEYLNVNKLCDAMLDYQSLPKESLSNSVEHFKYEHVAKQYLALCEG